MATRIRETELYEPIKRMLEGQGYVVKSEIGAADVAAVHGEEDPVIVELKTAFSLSLFHQAIDRQALTDSVYIAVPRGTGRAFLKSLKSNRKLCRRLGLGLITVRMKDGLVELHEDPAPYKPRPSKTKKTRLLKEFAKRVGDPNEGGSTRRTLMTAYRQDALRCAACLEQNGPTKAAEVARQTAVGRARTIMYADHYGWFERAGKGVYALSPKGEAAIGDYADTIRQLIEQDAADAL